MSISSKVIELPSGTRLSIGIQVEWFTLSKTEREFVFGLVDSIAEFEASLRAIEPGANPEPVEAPRVEMLPPDGAPGDAPILAPEYAADYSANIPEPAAEPEDDAPEMIGSEPSPSPDGAKSEPALAEPTMTPEEIARWEEAVRQKTSGRIRCDDCGETFMPQGISAHRRHAHAAAHVCGRCGYNAPGPKTLDVHSRRCVSEAEIVDVRAVGASPERDPDAHVHRYRLEAPSGETTEGICECGHRKLHPSDPGALIADPRKRGRNPACHGCGGNTLKDKHGYWCNACQLAVTA